MDYEPARKMLVKKYYYNKNIEFKPVQKKAGRKPKYGSPEEINKAYEIFLELASLSDADKDYLLSRGLSEKEILDIGFKSFPKRTIKSKLKKAFDENRLDFKQIPGFFQYEEEETFSFPYYNGILIPIKNSSGLIAGLQIRKTKLKDEDDPRYTWFSSAFASTTNEKIKYKFDGLGPTNPCHVEMVDNNLVNTIFITEGLFKALAIKKKFNSPSLSIQGVTNWKTSIKELEEVLILYPNIQKVIIALDSDFIYNLNVSKAISDMGKEIIRKFPQLEVFHLRWDPQYKGIDDLFEQVTDIRVLKKNLRKNQIEIFIKSFEKFYPRGKEIVRESSDKEVFKKEFLDILIKNNFK